jgi:hypothetical protein
MYRVKSYFKNNKEKFETDVKDELIQARNDVFNQFKDELKFRISVEGGMVNMCQLHKIVIALNRKWNSLRKMFIKELGFTVLAKDYFLNNYIFSSVK